MTVTRALSWPFVTLIRLYQRWISPMRPPTCRFYPSCSAYAVTALERFGPFRGGWLATRRLLRCHPWNPGGVDHVPLTWGAAPPAWRTEPLAESRETAASEPTDVHVRHTH